jgi:pilus assembly protein CpaE
MTLNCVVIGPDRELTAQLFSAFEEVGEIHVARDLHQYPQQFELSRMVRSVAPQAIFLSLHDMERGFETIEILRNEYPNLQIAVFHSQVDPQNLRKLMQLGIREFIAPPFDTDELAEAVARLNEAAAKNPIDTNATSLVYSFLPSKPGSGTTTLAVNAAIAMAKRPESQTLLMDFDLNSGLVRFLLKLHNEHSIIDAAQHAGNMEESLWQNIVCSIGQLDVIHTAKITPGARIESAQVRSLIDYARRQYRAICIDLSGNMERYALEIMQESKTIFIVCTPEIASLHLAREKHQYLRDSGLEDRVSFLLNRSSKSDVLQMDSIQGLLGQRVAFSFPNDYRGVNQAVAEGKPINTGSELGKQIQGFASHLIGLPPTAADTQAKKKPSGGLAGMFGFGSPKPSAISNSETKA